MEGAGLQDYWPQDVLPGTLPEGRDPYLERTGNSSGGYGALFGSSGKAISETPREPCLIGEQGPGRRMAVSDGGGVLRETAGDTEQTGGAFFQRALGGVGGHDRSVGARASGAGQRRGRRDAWRTARGRAISLKSSSIASSCIFRLPEDSNRFLPVSEATR